MTRYSEEEKSFILANCKGTPVRKLADMLGKAFGREYRYESVRAFLNNRHLRTGVKPGLSKAWNAWPDEIRDYIVANHKGVGPKEMAEKVNNRFGTGLTRLQMKGWYKNHNLNSGLTGHFEKGHVPFTAGKRPQDVARDPEALQRLRDSWFKSGHRPVNYLPVGSEQSRQPDGYVWIKIAEPNSWRMRTRVVWERINGPIPKGFVVIHKDGNKANDDPENLMMISRNEHRLMNRMGLRSEFPQLTETGVNMSRLMANVYSRNKEGGK